jgi:hypothetical protein
MLDDTPKPLIDLARLLVRAGVDRVHFDRGYLTTQRRTIQVTQCWMTRPSP